MRLKIDDEAPDFALPDQDGNAVKLRDLRGKKVVLYFYPKDDTPGCTKEACSFRDTKMKGMVVLGVSRDSVESHKRFAEKYGLPFTLLSDRNGDVCKAYDTKGIFTKRTTFIIGPDGRITKIFENVKPEGHAEEVLNN